MTMIQDNDIRIKRVYKMYIFGMFFSLIIVSVEYIKGYFCEFQTVVKCLLENRYFHF